MSRRYLNGACIKGKSFPESPDQTLFAAGAAGIMAYLYSRFWLTRLKAYIPVDRYPETLYFAGNSVIAVIIEM